MGFISVPWDFFHLGLLLVIIMVFITGIVICVAVTGVCCFHWLDKSVENQTEAPRNRSKTSSEIRDQIIQLDNELNEQMRRYQGHNNKTTTKLKDDDGPPSYDVLFPTVPSQLNFDLGSSSIQTECPPVTFNLGINKSQHSKSLEKVVVVPQDSRFTMNFDPGQSHHHEQFQFVRKGGLGKLGHLV